MHRLSVDANGRVTLPRDVRRCHGLETTRDFLLGKTESGLAFYPLRPEVRRVYLEQTARCNLHCRTCVRNVWEEPLEDRSAATFERVLDGLRELPHLREVVFGAYGELRRGATSPTSWRQLSEQFAESLRPARFGKPSTRRMRRSHGRF